MKKLYIQAVCEVEALWKNDILTLSLQSEGDIDWQENAILWGDWK